MIKHIDKNVGLDALFCTAKAQRNIQNFTNDLSGRERQLLILMTRDSNLCHRACESLLAKIDLNALVERGYLDYKYSNSDTALSYDDDMLISEKAMSPVNDDMPEAFLQIAAGRF